MRKMRKIVIHCQTNQCGTDSWEFVEVGDEYTIEELDTIAHEYALSNAEMYGIYPPCDDDTDEEAEDADDNIGGYWYDYVPEKHDMNTTGGGKPNWR